MENLLQDFRNQCGWSQEAMAAALKVSAKTISRWERASVPDLNPFLSSVWSTASRYSAHLYRYAHAALPAPLIRSVRNSAQERSLLIGPEAIVLAMSEETKKNWGLYRYYEGLSIAAFMSRETKAQLAQWYDEMKHINVTGDVSRVVHMITDHAPLGSKPPLWRRHAMRMAHPLVYDLVSWPIPEAEFTAATQKIWVSHAEPLAEAVQELQRQP